MSLLLLLRPDYQNFIPSSFHGGLDEVAVYPSALSADRIRRHYETAKAIPGRYYDEVISDAPTGFWRLDEAAASPVLDSANAYNGTKSVSASRVEGALGIGASVAKSENMVAFYLREMPLDLQTQLDVDGTTMAELNMVGKQPDYDIAKYINRTQADLDLETQLTLDGDTQFNLERLPDYVSDAWIEVKLRWSSAGSTLTIFDANGDGETFTGINISDLDYYYLQIDLEGSSIRVQIFLLDATGSFGSPEAYGRIFDTTTIVDENLFKRRKGRFGWRAQFADGDAYIENIRPRSLSFGEVVTQGFESNSPVQGASASVSGSSSRILFETIGAAPWGGKVTTDKEKSRSGEGIKIEAVAGLPLQGVQTNPFVLDDFDHTEIRFDIFFPQYAIDGKSSFEAFLFGEYGRIVPLNLGGFTTDKWQTIRVFLQNGLLQGGTYRMMLIQSLPVTDTTWYMDNISISSRSLDVFARASKPDAWGMADDNWVPFNNTINTLEGGVVFDEVGKQLQVKAKALRQDSFITELKSVPKYAELGRFYWPDAHPPVATNPVAAFTTSANNRSVVFDASSASNTGGANVAWYWSFGDGLYDYGQVVKHNYELAGTYTVLLTVIDDQGATASTSTSITV